MIDQRVKDQFQSNIKFKEICIGSLSRFYPWEKEQVIYFKNILDFDRALLMANRSINWEFDLFHEVEDKFDWGAIWKLDSLEIGLDFFEEFKDKIDFSSIYMHQNVDWSNQLLDTYSEEWDFSKFCNRPILASSRNIKKYGERYDWSLLSSSRHLKLNKETLDQNLIKWNWNKLCANPAFKVSHDGIKKHSEYINWSRLSRNPSMLPFILAFPNEYSWNWTSFLQNPALVLSDKLIDFLIIKFKKNYNHFKVPEVVKEKWARARIVKSYASVYAGLENIRNSKLCGDIPYGELIKINPSILDEEELVEHWNFQHIKNIIPNGVMRKFPLSYIKNNLNNFLEYPFSVFRYGKIDEEFIGEHIEEDYWFQLAFNESFEWTIEFLLANDTHFEKTYGLSQNKKIYELLFSKAEGNELEEFLKKY